MEEARGLNQPLAMASSTYSSKLRFIEGSLFSGSFQRSL
jgi:hypothetical protein